MRFRKTLSNWLNNRYLLIIRNEENFAEKTTISFTYAKVVLLFTSLVAIIMVASLFLTETLLAQWFDPRHEQMETQRQFVDLSSKVDSLEKSVLVKDIFIRRIQHILSGDTTEDFIDIEQDIAVSGGTVVSSKRVSMKELSPVDSQFRQEFESMDIGSGKDNLKDELPFLFAPLNGYVSQSYNQNENHFGVDIVTKLNEPVKSVTDGTVIFADWTREYGYVISIQHRRNLISVYKHNAKLLKKVGNFVSEGEIVAIVGNSGELTDGPHLHFELWYNGSSLNPEEFVLF